MSQAYAGGGRSVTLEQLIAINDEIVALIRAGVPLELGLKQISRDLPDAVAVITNDLALKLSRGQDLASAFDAAGDRFPKLYTSVISAGMRAGNLPAALEGVTALARGTVEIRKAIGVALIYPLIVLLMAHALLVGIVLEVVPRFDDTFRAFRLPNARLSFLGLQIEVMPLLNALHRTVPVWGWVVPILVAVLIAWWFLSVRTSSGFDAQGAGPLRFIPGLNRIFHKAQLANFADMLALLLEHQVPMPESLMLAAHATGNKSIVTAARSLADDHLRGAPVSDSLRRSRVFPPLLRWLLISGGQSGTQVSALQQAAAHYRSQARTSADWFRLLVPVLLVVIIGGGATLLYGLALFLPISELLRQLGTVEAPMS